VALSGPIGKAVLALKTPDGRPKFHYPSHMKIIALAVVAATLSAPLHAEPAPRPIDGQAPAEKPAATCVCDQPGFKPVTERAVAVKEYWEARRKTKISAVVGGIGVLFSMIAQSPHGLRESTEGYEQARSEMWAARRKAEAAGALVVRGDDLDGDIEIKLVKGVDYVIGK
jgi:hypothetical protein